MSKKSKKTTDSANNQALQIFGAIDSNVNIQDGINHHYHGRLDLAQKVYLQLLSNNPNNSDALHLLGVTARKAGDLNKSNDLIEKAIELNSEVASYHYNLGTVKHSLKQLNSALASYNKAIFLAPENSLAHHGKADVLQELNQLDLAIASYDLAINLNPEFAESHHNKGVILYKFKQFYSAVKSYDKAIYLNPNYIEAYTNRGIALKDLLQFESALASFNKAIDLDPNYSLAYSNKGNLLLELKQFEYSIICYDYAIALNSEFDQAYSNRGVALYELKQYEDAITSYKEAIALNPSNSETYSNLGNALLKIGLANSALTFLDIAITINPNYSEAYSNRGLVLYELGRFDEAVASHNIAIELSPNFALAFTNRGIALEKLFQFEAAIESFDFALSLNPDSPYISGWKEYLKMGLCDWDQLEVIQVDLQAQVNAGRKVLPPLVPQTLFDSVSLHRKAAEIYINDKYPAINPPMWSGQRYEHAKIRLAYVSCDFKVHPAALNNIQIWERLDRNKFEVIAISYGEVPQEDATPLGQMRGRLLKAFDQFLDVGDKSDEQIAQLMRDMEIDIAVDLSGLTSGGRQGILAHRPAPVQVNFYSFTSGAPYIDYIMATQVMIPPEHQHGYTEKVVYLPDTSIGVDTSRQVSNRQFTRGELGLPESGVVYCSFNNAYKINPQMFDVWMRVLLEVPGSVLWLQGGSHEKVKENLRREASARGVDPSRLVFAARMGSIADHLARHRAADVFLDTLPFNAHTTAADALWAGLPVLTCLGEGSFGRIAGNFLMALGMPELVMRDMPAYEAMAVSLGKDAGLVQQFKDKLSQQRLSTPLFDMERLTWHVEMAYIQMHEKV